MGKLTSRIHVGMVTAGAVEGLNLAAHRVQAVTVPLTPEDLGDLRSSLTVVPADADTLTSAVVSDSPYAVAQHENLAYRHKHGQAKYLEAAVIASKAEVRAIMLAAAKRSLT
jgi:hypothetical protein